MVILIEILVLCAVFTLMVCIMAKNPIATLYNYPPKIQERVKSLPEYKDKIPTTKNMVFTKLLAAIMMVIIISLILRYINGYTTFKEALVNSYLIWTVVNVYDVIVMDILWFCHDKRFVFKGTEDMVDEYHNYWFHIKGGIIGQVIGAVVCVIVGIVIQFVL
ncbi:MAG: hypothetical protein IJX34_03885 [Clostridia bacterium]|nr:hypothetical protein [Clostridia bacterium]